MYFSDLFATLADSSVNSIDLRQISLEDKRFEQIVSLIKTARAKHQKIKKLLPTASKIPAVLEGVKLSGVDHIWISKNDNLTLDGLNKVLMGVDDKDRTCSAPKRMEERQTDSRRCSLVTNKAEFLERINNSKSMPIIHWLTDWKTQELLKTRFTKLRRDRKRKNIIYLRLRKTFLKFSAIYRNNYLWQQYLFARFTQIDSKENSAKKNEVKLQLMN